ncbi:hypothetical protein KKC91_08730 [bacterium]|nr:hypothetical protein [bacterium]
MSKKISIVSIVAGLLFMVIAFTQEVRAEEKKEYVYNWVEVEGYVSRGMDTLLIETDDTACNNSCLKVVESEKYKGGGNYWPYISFKYPFLLNIQYYIWLRVQSPVNTEFLVRVKDWVHGGVQYDGVINFDNSVRARTKANEWVWLPYPKEKLSNLIKTKEQSISHLYIFPNQIGAKIDSMLVTTDPDFIPKGKDTSKDKKK